jgi:F0F1-type ATP synthase membrane subunit a
MLERRVCLFLHHSKQQFHFSPTADVRSADGLALGTVLIYLFFTIHMPKPPGTFLEGLAAYADKHPLQLLSSLPVKMMNWQQSQSCSYELSKDCM